MNRLRDLRFEGCALALVCLCVLACGDDSEAVDAGRDAADGGGCAYGLDAAT